MKRLTRYAGLIAGASLLTAGLGGCTPDPKATKPQDAQAIVDMMTYVKAKNGICYGVATVERMSFPDARLAVNQMMVVVDCGRVGL